MAASSPNDPRFPVLPTLLVMNIFPLVGVLFFHWSFFAIIYIYWWETVIMSIFNILKMRRAKKPGVPNPNWKINNEVQTVADVNNKPKLMATYISIRFFTLFIYLVFIIVFIGMYSAGQDGYSTAVEIIFFLDTFMQVSIVVVFAYYLIDFITWRLSGMEHETSTSELAVPFDGRSIVMHIVIVLGAVSTSFLGEKLFGSEQKAAPILFSSFFVLMKTAVDMLSYKTNENREKLVWKQLWKQESQEEKSE